MNKHARPTILLDREQSAPKHMKSWSVPRADKDFVLETVPRTPGKHAKPFGKHHPATPVTYNQHGKVTPLRPTQHTLDVAA